MPNTRASVHILTVLISCTALAHAADLESGFRHPPADARPWVYWFWLNGNLTKEGITADLEAMERVGIGGVLIMEVDQGAPLGSVDFAGAKWRELFRHVVSEAHRLGLEVNMNDDAGWNGSGGPWITPDVAMQKVVWSETEVEGPVRCDTVLPQPNTVAGYYRDIAVLAFPSCGPFRLPDIAGKSALLRRESGSSAEYPEAPAGQSVRRDSIVDLTPRMSVDGRLTWEVPAGRWTILRIGHTPTGAQNAPAPESGRGLECDKLSKKGSDAAFNGFIAKLVADNRLLAGKALVATHIDSWENGSQNWTPRMPEEFQRRRGYALLPFLPAITGRVVDSVEVSERFLYDFRQTISDLVVRNYAGHMQRLANRHGLRLTIEAYGDTTVDNLAYAGRADEPMGEFWSWPGLSAQGILSQMSSAAHVYGKRIVGAEAFTANAGERWQHHPRSLKAMGDTAFCLGINRFVFHRYAMQPWLHVKPGMGMGPWGLHYERTQTWWEQSKPWHEYLARCQYLLRQGLPVVDILCLAPEGAPRSFNAPPSLARTGYKADACSTEALLYRATVHKGRIVFPEGTSYRVLMLPGSATMTPQLLRRLEELVRASVPVVGARPKKAPGLTDYPQCDTEVSEAAQRLWGTGEVVTGKTADQVLSANGLPPDFKADRDLEFIHRRVVGTDVYFVANAEPYAVNATCAFRATGREPELWRPETGAMAPAAVYTKGGGVTRIPLRLEASESVFVVFGKRPAQADPVARILKDETQVWPPAARKVKITVRQATWSPLHPGKRTWDVTKQIQQRVNASERSFKVATLASIGDPAPNIVKTLRVEYEAGGKTLVASATDPQRIAFGAPPGADRIVVKRAVWGPADDELFSAKEVTAQVQRLVDTGLTSFVVAELASEGDPAPGVVKTLQVTYEAEGTTFTASATDPERLSFRLSADDPPPLRLERTPTGRLLAVASEPGQYEIRTARGRRRHLKAGTARVAEVTGPWQLRFPHRGGAPNEVTLDKLVSWSEHPDPGVQHFSGSAVYKCTFQVPREFVAPRRRVTLDLGRVEVIAEVRLNGHALGTLWNSPYQVDATTALTTDQNTLAVRITNLWPNRMIGDEDLPEDSARNGNGTLKEWPQWVLQGEPSPTGRFTFASWRLWHKGEDLLPSGLLGPVRVVSRQTMALPGW